MLGGPKGRACLRKTLRPAVRARSGWVRSTGPNSRTHHKRHHREAWEDSAVTMLSAKRFAAFTWWAVDAWTRVRVRMARRGRGTCPMANFAGATESLRQCKEILSW